MARAKRIEGVLAPVITPFRKDYAPDAERFVRHCRWLLKNGCSGLAVFGTNSEANSMSVPEKRRLLEALIAGGIAPAALMPGTGHCALTDSVELTRAALEMGCAGVLMLPPFYYKNLPDEGLYRNFAEVIERVGDERLQVYLYHIPPVSQVPISLGLIERLLGKYPGIVAGVKDSSGDWSNTKAMLEQFAKSGFDVFAGSEKFLLANRRHGGKGCTCSTGNRNRGELDNHYPSLSSSNGVTYDLENLQGIPALVESLGAIDVLVNNAGVQTAVSIDRYTDEARRRILRVNLEAPVELIRALSKQMIERKSGRIVNVASVAAFTAHTDLWYGVTKAGVVSFTRSFASYLGPHGIQVNAVAPGPVETELLRKAQPERIEQLMRNAYTRRTGRPEEIAEAIRWLALDAPGVLNGAVIDVTDGCYLR